MTDEEKKMQEELRKAREAKIQPVDTSLKPESQPNPINPNIGKDSFDSRLLPEGYKFGEGVRPDNGQATPAGNTNGYRRVVDDLYEAAKERVEQHPKQERLERAQALVSGITDLGRSIANMYFTHKGAPNGFKFDEGMSEAQRKRAERALAQREKEREAYYKYAMKGADMDYRTQKEKFEREQFEREQERKDKQLDLYYQREERMQQEAERKERMADWQKEYQQGQLDLKKAQIELRKWIEQGKMSRAQINHNLASWKRTKQYIFDDLGNKIGEEEERIVMNPDGTLATESSIKYDDGQGGGSSQSSGAKGGSSTPAKKKQPKGWNSNNKSGKTPQNW